MGSTKALDNFLKKLEDLEAIIKDVDTKLIATEQERFIYENANFFTKSFLINLCGYLESYLKDVLELLLMDISNRIDSYNLPYNFIRWNLESKPNKQAEVPSLLESKYRRFEKLTINFKKKDFDAFISGNPHRTKELFAMFGINLDKNLDFCNSKEIIQSIITKRNNVLHHDDDASDLSNRDILKQMDEIKKYAFNLDEIIIKHQQ